MSATSPSLGPGAEFDTIRDLVARWGSLASGIGDDAAVLRPTRGESVVVSVDAAFEGRHFRPEWLSPREIGYRAVAAALSDIAAMAARPTGILIAIGLPESWRDRLMDVADGIGDAATVAKTQIVGGNLSAAGELSITTTVLGAVFAPLTRAGGRDGDRVYVTGRLGGAREAMLALGRGESSRYRHRFAHPMPRLAEAQWLAQQGCTAAIDVSDGLFADLRHLAAANQLSITVDATRVPRVDGVTIESALSSGEEYELVVMASVGLDANTFRRRFDLELTEIGGASHTDSPNVLVPGVEVAALGGHDHLSTR